MSEDKVEIVIPVPDPIGNPENRIFDVDPQTVTVNGVLLSDLQRSHRRESQRSGVIR